MTRRIVLTLLLAAVCYGGTAANAGAAAPSFACASPLPDGYRVNTDVIWTGWAWYTEQWVCYKPNWWGPYFYPSGGGGSDQPMGADREIASTRAPNRAQTCYYGQVQYIGYPYILRCDQYGTWILLECLYCYQGGGGCLLKPGVVVPRPFVSGVEPQRRRTVIYEPPGVESACM